jgi:hypothetical protein
MPRWFQVALTLVLYSAAMWAVAWVAKQVVPPALAAGDRLIGIDGVLAVMAALWLAAVFYVWRDSRRRRR